MFFASFRSKVNGLSGSASSGDGLNGFELGVIKLRYGETRPFSINEEAAPTDRARLSPGDEAQV